MTYAHRNGEPEAPRVPGKYNFFGKRYGHHLGAKNYQIDVIDHTAFGVCIMDPYPIGEQFYEGRWWGPVSEPTINQNE